MLANDDRDIGPAAFDELSVDEAGGHIVAADKAKCFSGHVIECSMIHFAQSAITPSLIVRKPDDGNGGVFRSRVRGSSSLLFENIDCLGGAEEASVNKENMMRRD